MKLQNWHVASSIHFYGFYLHGHVRYVPVCVRITNVFYFKPIFLPKLSCFTYLLGKRFCESLSYEKLKIGIFNNKKLFSMSLFKYSKCYQ